MISIQVLPSTIWEDNANCIWVHEKYIFDAETPQDTQRAKKYCGECAVRTECLEYALGNRDDIHEHKIYGGLTQQERADIPRAAVQLLGLVLSSTILI